MNHVEDIDYIQYTWYIIIYTKQTLTVDIHKHECDDNS